MKPLTQVLGCHIYNFITMAQHKPLTQVLGSNVYNFIIMEQHEAWGDASDCFLQTYFETMRLK